MKFRAEVESVKRNEGDVIYEAFEKRFSKMKIAKFRYGKARGCSVSREKECMLEAYQ